MINRSFFIVAAFFLPVWDLMAQTAVEDIRKINLSFTGDQVAIQLVYRIYADSVAKEPIQSEEGKWIKSGNAQYQVIGKIETLRKAGDLQITLDHENKVAVLSNAPVTPGDEDAAFSSLNVLQEVINECRYVRRRNVNQNLAAYDLYPSASEFSRITVVYDKKLFHPTKMILQYAGTMEYTEQESARSMVPRMEIEFNSIQKNNGLSSLPEITKYVIKKGNSYELVSPYKEYQFNNYLLTN
jgi:hypothetical protein